jgi:hypothetical protein
VSYRHKGRIRLKKGAGVSLAHVVQDASTADDAWELMCAAVAMILAEKAAHDEAMGRPSPATSFPEEPPPQNVVRRFGRRA